MEPQAYSGGMFIDAGYGHFVFAEGTFESMERVVVHASLDDLAEVVLGAGVGNRSHRAGLTALTRVSSSIADC